ncbi:MAG TPA: acetamidase/formamidase family protein, partial [Puia sp.]
MRFLLLILSAGLAQFILAQDAPANGVHQHIHYSPLAFSNKFSLHVPPVLRLRSGDTVSTETIDALGFDKQGVKRQKGGNPLTGPFYIENALPGDVLAIALIRVSLNRSYAYTTEAFGSRSLPKTYLSRSKKAKLVRWKLDIRNVFASPDTNYEHLSRFKVPLAPFLGCIGLAPTAKKEEILSFFSGPIGGNLDYSRVTQGATVYLP